ncbi:DUF3180 domain-containing protein [Saccharopolyspora sp. CA-218241]|uniref:DUF3180 domain-containing protein n=1 Tax=Saccharopolyspora sp. CA-218241 TaxID=3240027 RepID=UPI003D99379C
MAPRQDERMTFTQPRQLLTVALVGALVSFLGTQLFYGSLPPLPLPVGATLLVVAVIDLVLAIVMRPRIRRKEGVEPVDRITAARAVALAKASSLAGALMGGIWIGLLAYLSQRWGTVDVARSDALASVVGLISAAALVGAGLWLEHCLRNPDEPDEPDDRE